MPEGMIPLSVEDQLQVEVTLTTISFKRENLMNLIWQIRYICSKNLEILCFPFASVMSQDIVPLRFIFKAII